MTGQDVEMGAWCVSSIVTLIMIASSGVLIWRSWRNNRRTRRYHRALRTLLTYGGITPNQARAAIRFHSDQ